ncbi:hypothetical protein HDF24_01490 [Mucilaginibacter sp. X4EP1]|jgi:hypothetical protein|nr:hypothetical protein [Mucilaginibacter sp. X4EP1]
MGNVVKDLLREKSVHHCKSPTFMAKKILIRQLADQYDKVDKY